MGVSRARPASSTGRALPFDHASAARFPVRMSMPITAAAEILTVPETPRVETLGVLALDRVLVGATALAPGAARA